MVLLLILLGCVSLINLVGLCFSGSFGLVVFLWLILMGYCYLVNFDVLLLSS